MSMSCTPGRAAHDGSTSRGTAMSTMHSARPARRCCMRATNAASSTGSTLEVEQMMTSTESAASITSPSDVTAASSMLRAKRCFESPRDVARIRAPSSSSRRAARRLIFPEPTRSTPRPRRSPATASAQSTATSLRLPTPRPIPVRVRTCFPTDIARRITKSNRASSVPAERAS